MIDATDAHSFLKDLGRTLRTQDGQDRPEGPTHATAWPVYLVEQKVRQYGIDTEHHGDWKTELTLDGELFWPEPDETLPPGVRAVSYIERWELVPGAVSLTRRGIEEYLDANAHNLCEPRIFVGSMFRVPEMQRLAQVLMNLSLAGPPSAAIGGQMEPDDP